MISVCTLLKQDQNSSSCGLACLGTLLELSVKETHKRMRASRRTNAKKNDHRVTTKNLKAFVDSSSTPFFIAEVAPTEAVEGWAFVYVKWPHDKRYRHWIIYLNGNYYDPDPRTQSKTPCSEYKTKPLATFAVFYDEAHTKPVKRRIRVL